jgi:tetraacyldisaccharide 4'-kinase
MLSVLIVAVVYLTMNLAIIGVIPWQEAMESKFVASEFMEVLFGRRLAEAFTVLILWTVLGSVFSMTLGYSRIPYAAARNGYFFKLFAIVHPVRRYPIVSLASLGILTAVFCYLPLAEVIEAAVIVRILVQFIGQIVALHVLRRTRPEDSLPFRMWLYPLPSLAALAGWIFLLVTAKAQVLSIAGGVLISGCLAYAVWDFRAVVVPIYLRIISDTTAWPAVFTFLPRAVLAAAADVYEPIVRWRNRRYDLGVALTRRVPVPVVSVGNLTAGGTGKTPVAAFLGNWFRERGVSVAFVSRGYGAAANSQNDEALVLSAQCAGVVHLQDPDRAAAALRAAQSLCCQLVILDDGFQHRRLARDLDIVLVDATNPWGFGHLLPRGLLREPISSLNRAGMVLITRVDLVPRSAIDELRELIESVNPGCPIAEIAFPPKGLIDSQGGATNLGTIRGRSVAAFCGIGNPAAFRRTLESLGCSIAGFREFPDHHRYTAAEWEELESWVANSSAEVVVCTQKDLVKIPREQLGNRPLWAVEIGMRFVAGEDVVANELSRVLPGRG